MNSAKYSEFTFKSVKSTTSSDPSPYDFAKYLQWACSQYEAIDDVYDVYVTLSHSKDQVLQKSLPKNKINKALLQSAQSVEIEREFGFGLSKALDFLIKEPVNITTTYDKFSKLIKVEFEKNKQVPLPILRLFLHISEYHTKLNYLVMRCDINQQTIHLLCQYLPSSNITHLYLDDTYIPEANYYTLLSDSSKLLELSLARCEINDIAVSLIAEKLAYPNQAARVLLALNLSSNKITDVGAFGIAAVLRCNRKLVYLNLAGNQLSDNGASAILSSLVAFPLNASENLQRTKDHVPYMLNKLLFFAKDVEAAKQKEKERRRSRKRSTIKLLSERKLSTLLGRSKTARPFLEKKTKSSKSSPESKSIPKRKPSLEKKSTIVSPNEEEMEKNPMRPFRSQETYSSSDVIWCYGNNILCYINFAYNDLTCFIIKKILDVLKQQQEYNRNPKGLIRVRLEGNRMPFNCRKMEEVNAIFEAQYEKIITRKEFGIGKMDSSKK